MIASLDYENRKSENVSPTTKKHYRQAPNRGAESNRNQPRLKCHDPVH